MDGGMMLTKVRCLAQSVQQHLLGSGQGVIRFRRVGADPVCVSMLCIGVGFGKLLPQVCVQPAAWRHGSKDVRDILQSRILAQP